MRGARLGQPAKAQKARVRPAKVWGKTSKIVTGRRRLRGLTLERRGLPVGVKKAAQDIFGLTEAKYLLLGERCRGNIVRALNAGASYQGTSGTAEELVCFGELLRRGFTYGLGSSSRSFEWQVPQAGSVLDFEVWDRGTKVALRPMNRFWHGHLAKMVSDDEKADKLRAAGLVVFDIWSEDSLNDFTLVEKFNQFFGQG